MFTLEAVKKKAKRILITLATATILVSGNTSFLWMTETTVNAADLSQIPSYTGNPYTIVNDNEPEFDKGDFTTEAFENTAIWMTLEDAAWPMQISAKN